jgi:outer membrane protein assembly factor BamB
MRCVRPALGVFICLGVWAASFVAAADWPQWRGPNRDGVSQETGLFKEWPKEGPKLVWQAKEIGSGFSTPAVVGDRIYLIANKGMDDEFVEALDAKDGSVVWKSSLGKVGKPNQRPPHPAARSTPTIAGSLIFALSSNGDLACLDKAEGKKVWQKSLIDDFGGHSGQWAYSESPLVDDDAVVCTPGGKEATILALDKKTGDVIWKCAVPQGDDAAYASIVIAQVGGEKQYVQMLQHQLVGVDAKSGKLLWHYNKAAGNMANIPTPVASQGYVYGASGGRGGGGGGLVKLATEGDDVAAEQVYYSTKLPTAIGGSVKIGDDLYGTNGSVLMCADFATGDIKWTERSIAPASLIYADGMLYLHGESGDVALVEATPGGYHEKGKFTPPDPPDRGSMNKAWAYPVVANGRLYIRDASTLWCFDVKNASANK